MIAYVSQDEFDATVAAMKDRAQAARIRKFAGKRERTFTVNVATCSPLGGIAYDVRKIKGFTLEDAKEQAGIQ